MPDDQFLSPGTGVWDWKRNDIPEKDAKYLPRSDVKKTLSGPLWLLHLCNENTDGSVSDRRGAVFCNDWQFEDAFQFILNYKSASDIC